MAESRDWRSSSRESAPKFPKCSHFRRWGKTRGAANNVDSMTVAMNIAGTRLALSVNHGYQRIWLHRRKPSPKNSQRKAAAASNKLQEAMDDSVEIHALEETLGPQKKKSKTDGSSHHKLKSKSDKPATESRRSSVADRTPVKV